MNLDFTLQTVHSVLPEPEERTELTRCKGKLKTANNRTGHPIQLPLHLQNTCMLMPETLRSSDSSADNGMLLTHGGSFGGGAPKPGVRAGEP